jgi:hypothetical protein
MKIAVAVLKDFLARLAYNLCIASDKPWFASSYQQNRLTLKLARPGFDHFWRKSL